VSFDSEPSSEIHHALSDLIEDSLIFRGIRAIRIFDVPVHNFFTRAEDAIFVAAGHIDYKIGGVPKLLGKRLGSEAVGGAAVLLKRSGGELGDETEREKTGARGFDDVESFSMNDRLRHRAAARIADADEQNAKFGRGRHHSLRKTKEYRN
jgi:hypothetical protein